MISTDIVYYVDFPNYGLEFDHALSGSLRGALQYEQRKTIEEV